MMLILNISRIVEKKNIQMLYPFCEATLTVKILKCGGYVAMEFFFPSKEPSNTSKQSLP